MFLHNFVVVLDQEIESAQIVFDFVDIERSKRLDSGHNFNHFIQIVFVYRRSIQCLDDIDQFVFLQSIAFDLELVRSGFLKIEKFGICEIQGGSCLHL